MNQYSYGVIAEDAVRNMSSFIELNGMGSSSIIDYNAQIVYYVDGNQNCNYYCPLSGIDTICQSQADGNNIFCSYDYLHYAWYKGSQMYNETIPADNW